MKMKRRITVFVATFAVVMIGGAALAAVGVVSPPTSSPTSNIAAAATEPEAAPTSPAISTSPDALTPADTQPRLDIRLDASDLVPVHEFTAHQRYEVVDGWPVVNYYWGTAKPGAEVHIGSEYGRGTTAANDDGKWEIRVEFPTAPCNEPFRVAAESGDHRKEFKMTRACRVHEFTAHQRYEVVDGWPVVNYYWGTAKPGAEVHIGSEYGRGTTAANDDGKWEIRVEFPTAPCNEPFRVAAESGDHRKEFKMTRACEVDVVLDFTAHQKYGECSEDVPYDVFWGTAAAGATITVESPHGRASTAAGEKGHRGTQGRVPRCPGWRGLRRGGRVVRRRTVGVQLCECGPGILRNKGSSGAGYRQRGGENEPDAGGCRAVAGSAGILAPRARRSANESFNRRQPG